jgi:hypothetical protein
MNSDLSVFNIPTDLLSRFEPTEKVQEEQLLNQVKEEEDTTAINARALERLQIQEERLQDENGNLTCRTCDLTFNSSQREEQRLHFNSDWHRYNIKRRLVLNAQPVSFEEFEGLLAGKFGCSVIHAININDSIKTDLTESISGSESESETSDVEDDDEKKDKIETLVDKQQEQEEVVAPKADLLPVMKKYTALCWFRLKDDVSQHYGIYRHLLTQPNVESVERIQASQFKGKKRMWAIIMIGGGHFAGSIMDVEKSGRSESLVKVLYHKTFHRYTSTCANICKKTVSNDLTSF